MDINEHVDFSRFTPEVLDSIQASARLASQLFISEITPLHLIVGLASINGGEVCAVLAENGYDANLSMEKISEMLSSTPQTMSEFGVGFSSELVNVFKVASRLESVTVRRLTGIILENPSQDLSMCLVRLIRTSSPAPSIDTPVRHRDYQADDATTGKTIKKFCINMIELAAKGKYRHAIGREEEIKRVLLILARNTKNNPVLIGEPGTGKTAIAEELAMRLYEGQVPDDLADLKLYSLDFTAIKASPDPVGIMKSILDEAVEDTKLVLFIDEIHMLISSSGCADNDVANLLKPAMARGEINIFGATTLDEYKRIEKDPAFERRFQPVIVDEPDIESAIAIVEGSKAKYEEYHSVEIPGEVAKAAVTLSDRYITSRKLPDKAFDLIDEAAANLRIQNAGRRVLKVNDLMEVVTAWTGIPVTELDENEAARLQNIEQELHASVIGQDNAVRSVAAAIRRHRMGFSDSGRPIGSFLFIGTSGTGKTELCKALAKFLFRDPDMIVRIDMSEYQQEHSSARLFGAPPGYVGYEQGGQLTDAVRRKPFSVVLFDEFEKAHPKIHETLLQVLDDGRMTDGQGKVVDFKNTIIVMTSNMGQHHILSTLCGDGDSVPSDSLLEECKAKVMGELRQMVRPEFLGRIDNVVMFHPLTKSDIGKIAALRLKKEAEKLAEKGININIDQSVIDYIVQLSYNPASGAREVKRMITEKIINPLTESLISGNISRSSTVNIVATNKIIFQ